MSVDELELLRELRDVVPERDDAARLAARGRLETRLSRPRRERRRWRLPGLAVVAAGVAVVVALVTGLGTGREADARAAQLLRTAAAQLRTSGAAPALGHGQYWYVESVGHTMVTSVTGSGSFNAITSTTHIEWVGPDGSGRIVRTDGDPQFPTALDRQRWLAAGSPALDGRIDEQEPAGSMLFPFGSRTLSYAQLQALPTDPDALGALVEQAAVRNSWSLSWQELDLIAELMRNAPLSPAQGAALYEVAARLPDVQLVGPTTDPSGRPGTGVAVTSNGQRMELVIDTATGQLLGDRQVDVGTGQVSDAMSYVRTGVVSSTTATP
jgi:hypothetical protein